MKATAKHNVNYNGVWYAKGDVIDVADADKYEMAEYCDFKDEYVPITAEPETGLESSESPRRGRRKKTEE